MLAGARNVIFLGGDDNPSNLRDHAATALSTSLPERVLAQLSPILSEHPRLPLRRLLAAASAPLSPRVAARLCCCHERSLRRHLAAAGLPPLQALLGWFRLLHAANLLDDRGRSIDNVSRVLGFASANAMRNQFQHYVGATPGYLRREGASELVLNAFAVVLLPPPEFSGGLRA